ncbi:MAG: hypothetical protein IJC02_00135 [Lachnospiraceae bacterium]|nr:hypothetical protein [Agathobacter sp.]MBQ3162942.1 hypothetical protein [Lachnospiraceae bacterium]
MIEEKSREEIVCLLIDNYVDLQRIKKANSGVKNDELDYQIKGTAVKLASMGFAVEGITI